MKLSDYNSLSKEEKRKVSFKQTPIAVNIVAFLILSAIVMISIGVCSTDNESIQPKESPSVNITQAQFDSASYEEKMKWIESYLINGGSQYEFNAQMLRAVRNMFKFPEEVKFGFGEAPLFRNGTLVDADLGFVFYKGNVTAKNAFGIKSKYVYQIRTVVKPDSLYIDNVIITELR